MSDSESGSKSGSDDESGSKSGSDSESGSGSGSDSGSGSKSSGSSSGSGSDSNSGSDSGSSSGSDSDNSNKKKNKKNKFKLTPFQKIMNSIREINFELDDVAAKVTSVCMAYPGGYTAPGKFGEEEKDQLMSDVDNALSGRFPNSRRSPGKGTRNYHAPDSPVRRTYEDGIEVDAGGGNAEGKLKYGTPGYA